MHTRGLYLLKRPQLHAHADKLALIRLYEFKGQYYRIGKWSGVSQEKTSTVKTCIQYKEQKCLMYYGNKLLIAILEKRKKLRLFYLFILAFVNLEWVSCAGINAQFCPYSYIKVSTFLLSPYSNN